MKIRTGVLAAGLLVVVCVSDSLQAHHSFAAEFDSASKVSLTGTVTKLNWRNPHTYFFVDVTDEKGVVHNWAFELGSPNVLMRRGWTSESLKSGDKVTVEGARARDGSYKANASSVVLASGQRLFNGTNEEEAK
jgi:hypothetical protein